MERVELVRISYKLANKKTTVISSGLSWTRGLYMNRVFWRPFLYREDSTIRFCDLIEYFPVIVQHVLYAAVMFSTWPSVVIAFP